jgi:hypothetical protein
MKTMKTTTTNAVDSCSDSFGRPRMTRREGYGKQKQGDQRKWRRSGGLVVAGGSLVAVVVNERVVMVPRELY